MRPNLDVYEHVAVRVDDLVIITAKEHSTIIKKSEEEHQVQLNAQGSSGTT
jgi:hypothetical protein